MFHNKFLNSIYISGRKSGRTTSMKKTKLKAKGKRYYKNTHGNLYRIKPNFKLNKKILLRKRERALKAQISG